MIIRVAYARVQDGKMPEIEKHFQEVVRPAVRSCAGLHWAYMARCAEPGHEDEVIFVSLWDSMEDVEAFDQNPAYPAIAGKAREFYKEDAPHLHYEVVR